MTIHVHITRPIEREPGTLVVRRVVDGGAYEEVRTLKAGEKLDMTLYRGVTITLVEDDSPTTR